MDKYPALRFLVGLGQFIAWATAILIFACGVLAIAYGSASQREGMSTLGIFAFLICSIVAFLSWVSLSAAGELVRVLVGIEENTRSGQKQVGVPSQGAGFDSKHRDPPTDGEVKAALGVDNESVQIGESTYRVLGQIDLGGTSRCIIRMAGRKQPIVTLESAARLEKGAAFVCTLRVPTSEEWNWISKHFPNEYYLFH